MQLIHQEKSEAEALLKLTPGSDQSKAMSKQLLADPVIFLRKWIGEVRLLYEDNDFVPKTL